MRCSQRAAQLGWLLIGLATVAQAANLPGECLDAASLTPAAPRAFPSTFQIISSTAPAVVGPVATTVTIAQNFEVTYYDTYKLVTNKVQNETYALYQCGLTPPPASILPANTKVFSIPLSSVTVSDTSIVAFLDVLGVVDRVSYVTEFAVNSCMQSLGKYGCRRVDPSSSSNSSAALAAQRQVVDGFMGFGASRSNDKSIAVTASSDPGPLNRAEWVKFVATFFNKEYEANQFFTNVATAYNSLKAQVAARAAAATRMPVVAWMLYQPPNPAWGEYGRAQVQISFAAYKAQYTQDAGGRMLDRDFAQTFVDNSSVVFQFNSLTLYNFSTMPATLRALLGDVDVLVDETRYPGVRNQDVTLQTLVDTYGFTAADLQNLRFLRDARVMREDARSNPDGYTDWFEAALARPDQVLRDLAAVVSPAAVPDAANAAPTIMRNMLAQPTAVVVRSAAQCPLQNCAFNIAPICPLIYRACNGSIVAATPTQRCAPTAAQCVSGLSGPPNTPAPTTGSAGTALVQPLALLAGLLLAFGCSMLLM